LDGVAALAELLARAGLAVSVSAAVSGPAHQRLSDLGVEVHLGYDPRHIDRSVTCLVYSPEVSEENVERMAARLRGVPERCATGVLARAMSQCKTVAIGAGCGKSTTAAMLGYVLAACGLEPTVFTDAGVPHWHGCCRMGQSDLFIAELPGAVWQELETGVSAAALLGVPAAHLDGSGDIGDIAGLVHRLARAVRAHGLLLVRNGAVPAGSLNTQATVQTFGLEPGCDWWAADLRAEQGRYRFRVFFRGNYCQEVRLAVPGRHNVLNALAAFALANWLGADGTEAAESLAALELSVTLIRWPSTETSGWTFGPKSDFTN